MAAEALAKGAGEWLMSTIVDKMRSVAAQRLKDGDVTDEELRDFVLTEIKQIKESLAALRYANFAVCNSNLVIGMELLAKGKIEAARKELEQAKYNADLAFGVVPTTIDKVAAAKIALTSVLILYEDDDETCETYIRSYVKKVNTIPEVQECVKAKFGAGLVAKWKRLRCKKERNTLLSAVSRFNQDSTLFALKIKRDIVESRKICYEDKCKDGSYVGYSFTTIEIKNKADIEHMYVSNDILYFYNSKCIWGYKLHDGLLKDGWVIKVDLQNPENYDNHDLQCSDDYMFVRAKRRYSMNDFILQVFRIEKKGFSNCIREIRSEYIQFKMHSFNDKIFYTQGKHIIRFDINPSDEKKSVELEQMKDYSTCINMTNYENELIIGVRFYGIVILDSDTLTIKTCIKTSCSEFLLTINDYIYGVCAEKKNVYRVKIDDELKDKCITKVKYYCCTTIDDMKPFKGLLFILLPRKICVYTPDMDLLYIYDNIDRSNNCSQAFLNSTPEYMYCTYNDDIDLTVADYLERPKHYVGDWDFYERYTPLKRLDRLDLELIDV